MRPALGFLLPLMLLIAPAPAASEKATNVFWATSWQFSVNGTFTEDGAHGTCRVVRTNDTVCDTGEIAWSAHPA